MRTGNGHDKGFTLVELLMTIAIITVLAMIALPAFGSLFGRTRTEAARGLLETSLNQARLAAVGRNAAVTACPSSYSAACDRSTRWHHGWIVFVDRDRDGMRSEDEPLLAAEQARRGVAILGTPGRLRVGYRPDGSVSGTNVTLTVCDPASGVAGATTLVVSMSGRIRHGTPTAEAATACIRAAGA